MTDHPDHNHHPLPAIAQLGQLVGGPEDGMGVAVIDSRDCLLMIAVAHDGTVSVQSSLTPLELANVTRQIAKQAAQKARDWRAAQS